MLTYKVIGTFENGEDVELVNNLSYNDAWDWILENGADLPDVRLFVTKDLNRVQTALQDFEWSLRRWAMTH